MRKKNWSKSQKVSEMLRCENFMDLRFRLDLTHINDHNNQVTLRSGDFPQIWGNRNFQNWGNAQDLGQ